MELIIREMDLERDALGIARMFNESDLAWPGTFIEGQPMTADMIREWHTEDAFMAVYLAVVDGEIAGYASFMAGERGQRDEGYLDLLNVNPKFHGLSIGRKLVQTCVNRAIKEGFKRHMLGTWSNNFKAVPVYKKTGHFWRPETSVWMQNYVPAVVQMPVCRPFFERHDWYDTYVRTVVQQEDDFRWEGLKVYPMRWEADGESLAVWIDREAQAPVAVETDELFVAAIPRSIEALHGDQVMINWRITNKTDTAQRFLVDARGADGLEIDHREMFVVQPGATVEHVAPVKVTDSTPYSKDDSSAPSVRSVITFGHDDVELFSGIRARKPIEWSTDPAAISVQPRRLQTLNLQLQNRRPEPVCGLVRLTPSEGLDLSWNERQVEIPAEGFVTLPVLVSCVDEQAHALEARLLVAGQDQAVTETWPVFAVGPGGLVAQYDARSARIETDSLRVTVAAKYGSVTLTDKATREFLGSFSPLMGPPFYTTEMHRREFSVAVAHEAGRYSVLLTAESQAQPGLVICERVVVAPSGLVEATAWLENRGAQTRQAAVRLEVDHGDSDSLQVAAPLAQGVVLADAGSWPRVRGDLPQSPAEFAEPWFAWQGRGIAAGMAWGQGVRKVDGRWQLRATGNVDALASGERSAPLTLALCGFQGDWRAVRERLCAWAGVEPKDRPVCAVAEANVEPQLMLTDQAAVSATVRAASMMNRAFDGQVTLDCQAPLAADWCTAPVPRLMQGQPYVRQVELALPQDQVGVYEGQAQLEMPIVHSSTVFRVVRVGLGGPVTVSQEHDRGHNVWRIDNGLAQFCIAPDYGPSVYSLQMHGHEQLYSHFPETRGLSWMHPFFGGIHPLLLPHGVNCYEGFLHRAASTAAPLEAVDRWGLRWTGVRVSARSDQEQLRAMLVELDVLTVGRAPVLKVVQRLVNERDGARQVVSGLTVTPSLGAPIKDLTLMGEGYWHRNSLIGNMRLAQQWGALVNPVDGRTALLVSNRKAVGLWATAQVARLFWGGVDVQLAARETYETTYYLVLADSLEQAKRYLILQGA